MPQSFHIRTWSKSLPSRDHPQHNEDLIWSARNGMAHAMIDGMGGARRIVDGKAVGGEHAAAKIGEVLDVRLQDLPETLSVTAARELLSVAVAEAGPKVFHEVNASGQIPASQVPAGKTAHEAMAAAVMTGLLFCEGGRRAVLGQNGDTRGYLFSGGELMLLTEDQDAVALDVHEGKLTEDDALAVQDEMDAFDGHDIGKLSDRARYYFVRRYAAFGQIGDSAEPQAPVFSTIQLRPGDVILLCSDGVYANLTTAEIRDGLTAVDPAAALVDKADARSGERTLPDPNDLSAPYNYRAHVDDTSALVILVEW
ncbi:MAG: SpoIIE family protein phosphatase [Chloroflexota bacterium]|nr:SpoIIE family protein phosphatase [Chloroflexota bacterium]MDQ5867245.1 SpoIIE family protein phosphatase [Chloroflexota bacterium]